jgi:hypothetical protein
MKECQESILAKVVTLKRSLAGTISMPEELRLHLTLLPQGSVVPGTRQIQTEQGSAEFQTLLVLMPNLQTYNKAQTLPN